MIGVNGLHLAIAFLMIFAHKGPGALPLALAGSFAVILFNNMYVWQTITENFAPGYTSAFTSYMVLFVTSAFYAKLMDVSGAVLSAIFSPNGSVSNMWCWWVSSL